MWIRVESFAPDSTTPTTTLNGWTDRWCHWSDEGGGTSNHVLSVGRKAGDVIFPEDKSVSRQHCVIKCLRHKQSQTETEGGEGELGHVNSMKEVYRRAMEANPFGCVLVVENLGKAGTYIAELPQSQVMKSTLDVNCSNDDDDDEATDDEGMTSQLGGVPQRNHHTQQNTQQQSQQQQQQRLQLAPLGDGVAAPEGWPLSASTKELWAERIKDVTMVKVDVDQSRVLDFSEPRSIIFQVGVHGSSIKISWLPFRVVFSRLPKEMEGIRKDLSTIGAVEESNITSYTTHVVTPEVTVSAKPLTACCRGLPLVTPAYLKALMDHTRPKDPIPSMSDFLSPYDPNMMLIKEKGANPKLMQGYTVFFLDHVVEMESLVQFSGGISIALYNLKNDKDRFAKVETTLRNASNDCVHVVFASKKRVYSKIVNFEGVYELKPGAWGTSISKQNPQLKGGDKVVIPTPSVEVETSSVTEPSTGIDAIPNQSRKDDDSDTDDEIPPSAMMTQKSKLQTQEEVTAPAAAATSTTTTSGSRRSQRALPQNAVTPSSQKRPAEQASLSSPESPVESSMTEFEAPTRKRRKRGEPTIEPIIEETTMNDWEAPTRRGPATSPNIADDEQSPDEPSNPDFPVDQDEAMDNDLDHGAPEGMAIPPRTSRIRVNRALTTGDESLGGADSNGWFAAAPKDDSIRTAWRQKASKLSAEEDGEHFQPAPASRAVAEVILPSKATPSQNYASSRIPARKTNGLDFRAFCKNIVPRKIDDSEIISMVVVAAREDDVLQEFEEEQRQLEIQQRVADELFRDIGASMPRRKRRA